jgi:hypothetical protein
MNTKMWTQKNGVKIRIRDMTDSHLTNTINLLARQTQVMLSRIPYPDFSGEMAQYYAEGEYDSVMESSLEENMIRSIDIAEDLLDEFSKRKLDSKLLKDLYIE